MGGKRMALIGLTKEQNEELRRMYIKSMENVDRLAHMASIDTDAEPQLKELGLIAFTQARTYLELGDFESDPRLPKC